MASARGLVRLVLGVRAVGSGNRRARPRLPARPVLVSAFALLLAVACGHDSPSTPAPPGDGTTPQLDSAFAAARQQPNVKSLVVAHEGVVVRQEYFHGGGANVAEHVRSVTKSVVSLLVGAALDRGCLHSVEQSVGEILGPLGPSDPAKAAVTLRHVLTMTSGIGGDELVDAQEYGRWTAAPNQLEYLWNLPVNAAAGTRFAYLSPAYHPASPIVTVACGQPLRDFARTALFGPLGIGEREWAADHQGFANGASELKLTPADMVSIGNLVLNGGVAGGQQVIRAEWVRTVTRQQVPTTAQPYMSGYGFGWWTGQLAGTDFAVANGWGGQFIVIVPAKRLVVTTASQSDGISNSTANAQWKTSLDIIMQRVVPQF